MNVTFYTFAKKDNSTKRPGGGAGYNVTLKEPSSVTAPVISLVWPGAGSPVQYNYAYIPAFARYYFIRNWSFADRQWTAEMVVDVLASWKTYIGNSTKYVIRGDKETEEDDYLKDGMYPVSFEQTIDVADAANPFYCYDLSAGGYIFGILASPTAGAIGGITYYSMTAASANTLMTSLYQAAWSVFDPTDLTTDFGKALETFGRNLVKSMINPMQFIVSAMWVPVMPTGTTVSSISLGDFTVSVSAYILDHITWHDTVSIPFSTFPLLVIDRVYELIEPYTYYSVEFQPFGIIPLSAIDLYGATSLSCEFTMDFTTGLAILRVYVDSEAKKCLATRTAQVGVNLAVSGSIANNAGGLMDIIGAVASVASENYVGAIGSVLNAANDFIPQARSSGTSGGVAGLASTPTVNFIRRHSRGAQKDHTEHGYVIMKSLQLSTISGYIMVDEGDIDAPATLAELSQIKAFLEGGFFYE